MVNIDSYKKGVHWPVSLNCIAGSGVQLIKVTCFSKVFCWPIIGFQLVTGSWGGGGVVLRISSDRDDGIGGKNQNPKKSLGLQTKPKKSHSKFPSYKNFQKALNET